MKILTGMGRLCCIFALLLVFLGGCSPSSQTSGTSDAGAGQETSSKAADMDSADTGSTAMDRTDLKEPMSGAEKKTVTVTTSFLSDMVKNIAGDSVEILQVIPAGSDPHLYVAKPQDFDTFAAADLILYHGLHFEGKMTEFLEKEGVSVSKNFPPEMLLFDGDPQGGEGIPDPHFWFNVELYTLASRECTDALSALVPEMAQEYEKNYLSYEKQLTELDAYIQSQLALIPQEQRYLITPHDAFQYFSKKYGIGVKAPQGTNTGSEVSNGDIQETIDFIVEHDIRAVFAETTTDPARMEKLKEGVEAKGKSLVIVQGEGQELFSDSLAVPGELGDTYIDMVRFNVDLIVKYLADPNR